MATAKTRLTAILTQAVGLVHGPANNRPFITLKSEGNQVPDPVTEPNAAQPANEAPKPETKAPLKMPGQVKERLSAALAAHLETVMGVADMVANAEVDDAAPIPTEPLFALDDAASQLDSTADEFIMEEDAAESAPESGGMGEAQMAAPEAGATKALKAKVKADEMPRRKARLIAKKRAKALGDVYKGICDTNTALSGTAKTFDGILKELAGEMAPPKKTEEPKKKSVSEEVQEALAPLVAKLSGVEGKLSEIETATKAIKVAPAQLPNGAREEGSAPPAADGQPEMSFQQRLAAAKKARG